MSQSHAVHIEPRETRQRAWQQLCNRRDLVANSGIVAWCGGAQIALFYLPGSDLSGSELPDSESEKQLYAIDNHDPQSGANVIGRGIVGQLKGQLVVASPLYKQHFRLADGHCLEYPEQALQVWPARLNGDRVEVMLAGNSSAVNS